MPARLPQCFTTTKMNSIKVSGDKQKLHLQNMHKKMRILGKETEIHTHRLAVSAWHSRIPNWPVGRLCFGMNQPIQKKSFSTWGILFSLRFPVMEAPIRDQINKKKNIPTWSTLNTQLWHSSCGFIFAALALSRFRKSSAHSNGAESIFWLLCQIEPKLNEKKRMRDWKWETGVPCLRVKYVTLNDNRWRWRDGQIDRQVDTQRDKKQTGATIERFVPIVRTKHLQ